MSLARALVSTCCLAAAAMLVPWPRAIRAQGTVSGRVTLSTPAPGAGRDLARAIVFLEPAGRVAPYERPAGDAPPPIVMRDREFVPHVQIVTVGGSVTFPNQDPFSHNVFSNTALGAFDLGLYRRGATRSATFARVGVYAVYCNIHASMASFVVAVLPALFAPVNDRDEFMVPAVPAGNYLIHAWYEGAPEIVQPLAVPSAGVSGVALTLRVRGFVPSAHLNKFGLPYQPAGADRY